MMPPISIDGTDITGATIDGQDVQEITVDGQTVFTAGPSNLPVAYSNLVAWYPFDSATYGGSNADDVTALFNPAQSGDSTAFDGTVNGATYQSSGGVTDINAGANSGAFDFSNDLIEYNTGNTFTAFNNDLSICIWHKADSLDDFGNIMGKVSDTNADSADLGFWTESGNIQYGANSNRISTSQSVSTGVWHHYALTSDSSSDEAKMYFDGNLINTSTANTKNNSTNDDLNGFYTGTFNGVFDFALDGAIDDARIYDKTLSGTEINQIYLNTEP